MKLLALFSQEVSYKKNECISVICVFYGFLSVEKEIKREVFIVIIFK